MRTSVYRIGKDAQFRAIVEICQDSPSARVILVMPEAATSLLSTTNLRLLAAYAGDYGKSLVLVTGDQVLQQLAERAGIPVYGDLQQAEVACYETDNVKTQTNGDETNSVGNRKLEPVEISDAKIQKVRGSNKRNYEKTEAIDFEKESRGDESSSTAQRSPGLVVKAAIVLVATLATIAFYYLMTPKVVLTIRPSNESVSFQISRLVSVENLIPLEHEVTGTLSVSATGSRLVGDSASSGEVVIYNLGLESVSIPTGTKLIALGKDKKEYRVVSAVDVPVGSVVAGKVVSAGKAEVLVEALQPGSQGNLPKGIEFQLEAPYSEFALVVTNVTDLTGGTDRLVPIVTEDDVGSAREKLQYELRAQAESEWYDKAAAQGEFIVPQQRLSLSETYDVNVKPKESASAVTARGNLRVSGWVIAPQELWSVVRESLAQVQVPGYQVLEESLRVQELKLRSASDSEDVVELVADVAVTRIAKLEEGLNKRLVGISVADLPEQLMAVGANPEYLLSKQVDHLPRWSRWLKVEVIDH